MDVQYSHKQEYDVLIKEGTRQSKKQARLSLHGAFKAHLKQKFGRSQLAFRLLRHPFTDPLMLLQNWKQYVASPEYAKEKHRSSRPHDQASSGSYPATSADQAINAEKLLKRRKNSKLWLYKTMNKYEKLINEGYMDQQNVPPHQQDMYASYLRGDLKKELDLLTRQHGYGKLRGDQYKDCCLLKPCGWTGWQDGQDSSARLPR